MEIKSQSLDLRRIVLIVSVLNLIYFFVEFCAANQIGSVSLFADSVDFLEDTIVNFLIAFALSWPAKKRAQIGKILAGVLLIPAAAFFWTAWKKFNAPLPPEPWLLSTVGLGALVVNLSCAFLLSHFRHHKGSLTRAAFFSARNDAIANIAIIGAGLVTTQIRSGWPDLIVGIGVAYMNADAALAVWRAAKQETLSAEA